MKTMRKLHDQTCDELDGCIEYAKDSIAYRGIDSDLSKMYADMAKVEMGHAMKLDSVSTKKAAEKKDEIVDPMLMEIWEEMHSDLIDKMAEAQAYLNLL